MRRLLLLGLVFAVAGCSGHGSRITIVETTGFGQTLQRQTFHLDCDPPGGLALAAETCAAIRAHPRAMLHPPPSRSGCGGRTRTLTVSGHGIRLEGQPACDWPGGTGLLLYDAAIRGDRRIVHVAASRLRCDEDPRLLARPTPWRSVAACIHDRWTPRSERLIAAAKRAVPDGRIFPSDVGVLPCAGVAHCGVSVDVTSATGPTVWFGEIWERRRHLWRVRVADGPARVAEETGPEPPRGLTWLTSATRAALARLTDDTNVIRIHYLLYPRKVAVVVEFALPAPMYFIDPPRGGIVRARALRFSYDRATRRVNGELRVCEVRGDVPPLAACLAR